MFKASVEIDNRQAILDLEHLKKAPKVVLEYTIRDGTRIIENESKMALIQGETRAIKTGRLMQSVRGVVTHLEGVIKPYTNYSGFIHFGTTRMRARPYMFVGAENSIDKIERIANNYLVRFTS